FDKDLANSRTSWYSIWVMFVCGYTVKIILFNDIATLLLTIANQYIYMTIYQIFNYQI
ncbi:hypothetical protein EZS27_031319, partial [termite gut metagenome]